MLTNVNQPWDCQSTMGLSINRETLSVKKYTWLISLTSNESYYHQRLMIVLCKADVVRSVSSVTVSHVAGSVV